MRVVDADRIAVIVAKFLRKNRIIAESAEAEMHGELIIFRATEPRLRLETIIVATSFDRDSIFLRLHSRDRDGSCYICILPDLLSVRRILDTLSLDLVKLMSKDVLLLHLPGIIATLKRNRSIDCYYLELSDDLMRNQINAAEAIKSTEPQSTGILRDRDLCTSHLELAETQLASSKTLPDLCFVNSNDFLRDLGVGYIFIVYRDLKITSREFSKTLYVVRDSDIVTLLTIRK